MLGYNLISIFPQMLTLVITRSPYLVSWLINCGRIAIIWSSPMLVLPSMIYYIEHGPKFVVSLRYLRVCKTKEEALFGWTPPLVDWFKINVDGSFRRSTSHASCGGIIRDSLGRFIKLKLSLLT